MTFIRKLVFAGIFFIAWLSLIEIVLHLLVTPSQNCYGIFFGRELPPFRIMNGYQDGGYTPENANKPVKDGVPITIGDVHGIHREDRLLGYVPRENSASLNRWWRSNNIGARDDRPTPVKPSLKRILAFGDSFTNCSALPQEDSWPFIFNAKKNGAEVINLGVDGYNMAQSYLRYQKVKKGIEYDRIMLAFSPKTDLWRDINVYRELVGWTVGIVLPRYMLVNDRLTLIESPYETRKSFLDENHSGVSKRFREYLRKYDSFYFPSKFESPPVIGKLIIYKLFARRNFTGREEKIYCDIMKNDSEAMRVSTAIFRAMEKDSEGSGKPFTLILFPNLLDIQAYGSDPAFRAQWQEMVNLFTSQKIPVLDLLPELLSLTPGRLDAAYDGWHYGPRANREIAGIIERYLQKYGERQAVKGQQEAR